jgi:Protein of unknown function (DUF2934)
MDRETEADIRELAQPLWESAAQPYGAALDFWLMAEQMVLEAMASGARMQAQAVQDAPDRLPGVLPETVPVQRINNLAQCMWEHTERQVDAAQDVWLAAERHVLTMLRAAATPERVTSLSKWAEDIAELPPQAYLERIRVTAYMMWEAAGRQYGNALDYWLHAEEELLGSLAAVARARNEAIDAPSPLPDAAATTNEATSTSSSAEGGSNSADRKRPLSVP